VGEKFPVILPKCRLPLTFMDLSHATKLRHGTDGFTSPPKEGVLRIFSSLKIRRLRAGLNPRTWVPKASTLPLDHRKYVLCHLVPRIIYLPVIQILHEQNKIYRTGIQPGVSDHFVNISTSQEDFC
jgi:hypothetical protein